MSTFVTRKKQEGSIVDEAIATLWFYVFYVFIK